MKKVILLISIIALSIGAFSCGGGGGSGQADLPPGENPASPSIVQVWPSHYIAQTNAYVTIYAKVLDGNGAPLSNIDVSFTNLSGVGILSRTMARTDSQGLATTTVISSAPGFSIILAQINTSQGIIRDRRSIYFTPQDVLSVRMDMDVDSVPGNNVFNEQDDFVLFQNASDDTFKVRATVYDAGGVPVAGTDVDWFTSHAEVTVVRSDEWTNNYGQAEAVFKVEPALIRNTETLINVMAFAGNGAANMVTLFLRPVTVSGTLSSVTASPNVVDLGGTSTITAAVMLNTGSKAPDGTVVNFSASCGSVTPFAATTGGVAEATFTAPMEETTCSVTARVGGVYVGQTSIVVRPSKLTIVPGKLTVQAGVGGKYTFTIHGGTPPYTTASDNPSKVCNSSDNDCSDSTDTGIWSGSSITVTIPADATPGDITLTVYDSIGNSATAKITIACLITIFPPEDTICENDTSCNAGKDTATFIISGGIPPYSIVSSNTSVIPNPSGNPFTVNASNSSISTDTDVTLTVIDSAGCQATATVKVINQ